MRCLALIASLALLAGCGAEDALEPDRRTKTVTIEVPGGGSKGAQAEKDFSRYEKACPGATAEPSKGNLREIARTTLCLVNHERNEKGLAPLGDDARLAGAARRKARDMVKRNYFEHVGPDGRDVEDWVDGTGYLPDSGYQLGENIAWAGEGGASPARIVDGWMNSPTHRRNILREVFDDSGIGVAAGTPTKDGKPGATYAHFFGTHQPPG